jgi:hypothetical protein
LGLDLLKSGAMDAEFQEFVEVVVILAELLMVVPADQN